MNTLKFSAQADDSEELARAEVYGLLSALFVAAPSGDLYGQLRVAATEAPAAGAFLEGAFGALVEASRRLPLAAVCDEYVALCGRLFGMPVGDALAASLGLWLAHLVVGGLGGLAQIATRRRA